jgi:hypothetical protein
MTGCRMADIDAHVFSMPRGFQLIPLREQKLRNIAVPGVRRCYVVQAYAGEGDGGTTRPAVRTRFVSRLYNASQAPNPAELHHRPARIKPCYDPATPRPPTSGIVGRSR